MGRTQAYLILVHSSLFPTLTAQYAMTAEIMLLLFYILQLDVQFLAHGSYSRYIS